VTFEIELPEHGIVPTLREVERRYVLTIMKRTEWNKTKAAMVLGIDRRTLYRMMDRMKLWPEIPKT
jgi:DNA-binding NtrC family response regulator